MLNVTIWSIELHLYLYCAFWNFMDRIKMIFVFNLAVFVFLWKLLRNVFFRDIWMLILVTLHSRNHRSRDLKHHGDKSLDLSSFPMKNPIFQLFIVNILGSLKFKFVKFCNVHLPLHLFPLVFLVHLSRRLKCTIVITCCPSSVVRQSSDICR